MKLHVVEWRTTEQWGNDLPTGEILKKEKGDYPSALDKFNAALARSAGVDNQTGDIGQARELYQQALAINRQEDDRAAIADNLSNLGTLSLHNGDTDGALAYYRQVLEIDKALETPRAIGLGLFDIASTYQAKQDFPQALEYCDRALPSFRLTSDLPHIAEILFRMGLINEKMGQAERAKQYVQATVEADTRAGMPELVQKARLKID